MAMSDRTLDKASALFSGLDLLRGLTGGRANNSPSFLNSFLRFVIRVWEEKGGSMKDESEMLETTFSDPNAKNVKLTRDERKKVSTVIKAMTPAERKVFRLAIMVMNPEEISVDVPAKPEKDGKDGTPAMKRTEKTGIDPRVNVFRGIAEHVKDDLSNAGEVVEMLRDTGALGGNNEALRFLGKMQVELKKILCKLFNVASIEDITLEVVKKRTEEILALFEVPDTTQPRPNDKAGWFVRFMRSITPGSFPNQ